MSNESKNETVWSVIILALMMSLSASVMMFGGQTTELVENEPDNYAASHQIGYQIQYSMDFFGANFTLDGNDKIIVNDAVTTDDGTTFVVGKMSDTTWSFGRFKGSVAIDRGFIAALTPSGNWDWVYVDSSPTGTSSMNAITIAYDGELIIAGEYSMATSWGPDDDGDGSPDFALSGGAAPYYPAFGMKISQTGGISWLENLVGNTRVTTIPNDVVVSGDVGYITGISTSNGSIFPGDAAMKSMGDSKGDAFIVKFSVDTGAVSHSVDNCVENDDNNEDGKGYCNPGNAQLMPRESGDAITVLSDGTVLVAVTYDNTTLLGTNITPELNENVNSSSHSDIAIWKLTANLNTISIKSLSTDQADSVVGFGMMSPSKFYLATNRDYFQGRLLELDNSMSILKTHEPSSGNLKILDITVDSGTLELVGFASKDIVGNQFIFEDQSYDPTNNASLFVAEYSQAGFQNGQALDISPTNAFEFFTSVTTAITANNGSIRIVTVSMPVVEYLGPSLGFQRVDQLISFAGTDIIVRPNFGVVAHYEWDTDQDGIPNRLDNYNDNNDPDHDGLATVVDNCPNNWNPQQENNDDMDDGGDACDLDDDNDGVLDVNDSCPLVPGGDLDSDGDGCPDKAIIACTDPLANNYSDVANTNSTTCDYDLDDDGVNDSDEIVGCMDGTADNFQLNATDPGDCMYTEVEVIQDCTNCSVGGDVDDDDDGVPDKIDECENTPVGEQVNSTGCEEGREFNSSTSDTWVLGDCDPTNMAVNCQEEIIIAGVGGAGLIGGSVITRWLRPGIGKGGPRIGVGEVLDAKDAYDFIAKKGGKKVKTTGGSDHYLKPGVERQEAMSSAADTTLDDYVED